MSEIQRAKIIIKNLDRIYPKITVPLKSRNVFTLLISVLLSAQCTDVNVNNVTKKIYPKYFKPLMSGMWRWIIWDVGDLQQSTSQSPTDEKATVSY